MRIQAVAGHAVVGRVDGELREVVGSGQLVEKTHVLELHPTQHAGIRSTRVSGSSTRGMRTCSRSNPPRPHTPPAHRVCTARRPPAAAGRPRLERRPPPAGARGDAPATLCRAALWRARHYSPHVAAPAPPLRRVRAPVRPLNKDTAAPTIAEAICVSV